MFYVYLLLDENDKTYLGSTNNLKRRFSEHRRGKDRSSRRLKNPKLFYYEAYSTLDEARQREKKLKQYGSSYTGLLKRLGLK